MCKKLLLALGMVILLSSFAYSQTGTIKGVITNQANEPVGFIMVFLIKDGTKVDMANTTANGEYQFFNVPVGTFDLHVDATQLATCQTQYTEQGVRVGGGQVVLKDVQITCSNVLTSVVVEGKHPVFDKDNTTSSIRVTGEDARNVAGHSVAGVLASQEGVVAVDGQIQSVRGNRSDGQKTLIDGVPVRGSAAISMFSVEELQLIQGGIPAEYGDGTSFTVITTRGISPEYHGSVEVMGSLEGYNNFLAAAFVTGPLVKRKNEKNAPAIMGFMLSGQAAYNKDSYPARGGVWRASDDLINSLTTNPNRYINDEFSVNRVNSEYITKEDGITKKRVRDNAASWNYMLNGKLDFILGKQKTINLSIGGTYDFNKGRSWSMYNSLFNSANNAESQNYTWRVYGRLNHRVLMDTAQNAVVRNVSYNVNLSYTRYNTWSRDANHKDNYFNYGHIGQYKTYKNNYFLTDSITLNGITWQDVNIMNTIYDSLVTFDGTNSSNPKLAYYTQNFVDLYPEWTINNDYYTMGGALLNGESAADVYTLFAPPGAVTSGYSKADISQLAGHVSLSMNIKDHEIKLGYQFEKATQRGFSVSPYRLWTLMRQKANFHIAQLDLSNPIVVWDYTDPDFPVPDSVYYNRSINLSEQSAFDRNLRTALGLDPNGSDWIDVDQMLPSTFSLDMFSAEELLVGISGPMVSYYGYDYTGTKKYNKKTNIKDFFTAVDEEGNKTYNIGAYEPIYMSLYLQDKFSIRNLLFNVGVRVDRFDANQPVLNDPYLFRPAYTVGDTKGWWGSEFTHPNNMGDDYTVYVNTTLDNDPANVSVIGYRNGSTWYDTQGREISNPEELLGATGGPLLVSLPEDGSITKVSYEAFGDYAPQWSVMPRISFSFPVSDQSLFYAHYNIITKRPSNLMLNPISYLFIEKFGSNSNNIVNNPNLKPEMSIDYEIGFRQRIGENSAISFAAYYSEKRDQIQSYRYSGAYPQTYYSYANIDFGTVQGFTLSYKLRRTKNLDLSASYTLQFAKGTGSSSTSGLAIIANGQPNLRTLSNLSFDQRHRFTATIDYRFGSGTSYNGPVSRRVKKGTNTTKEVRWFENAGINLNFSAGSGTPYTRSSTPNSIYVAGTVRQTSGSINGSNMPWIFSCDLRIDKSFDINLSKDKDKVKKGAIMVYLEVMNLFNFKNIIYVYDYTGNPDDDGYLSAAQYQQQINAQTSVASFTDLYQIRVQDPYNYTMPTRVSLGIQFAF